MQTHDTLPRFAGHRPGFSLQHGLWIVPLALLLLAAAFSPSDSRNGAAIINPDAPLVTDWRGNSGHIPAAPVQPAN